MTQARVDIRKLQQFLIGQQVNPSKAMCSKNHPIVLIKLNNVKRQHIKNRSVHFSQISSMKQSSIWYCCMKTCCCSILSPRWLKVSTHSPLRLDGVKTDLLGFPTSRTCGLCEVHSSVWRSSWTFWWRHFLSRNLDKHGLFTGQFTVWIKMLFCLRLVVYIHTTWHFLERTREFISQFSFSG